MSESDVVWRGIVRLFWHSVVFIVCVAGLVVIFGDSGQTPPNILRVFLALLLMAVGAVAALLALIAAVPADARPLSWSDPIVARLTSTAIVFVVSEPWISPFLQRALPFGDWPKLLIFGATILLLIALPRKLNAPLARLVARTPAWLGLAKEVAAIGVGLWTLTLCLWLDSTRRGVTHTIMSIGGVTVHDGPSSNTGIVSPIVMAALALMFWYFSRHPAESEEQIGIIVATPRAGLPALAWSQRVGTGDTEANEDARGRFKIYLGLIAVAAVLGLASGSFENAILWTVLAVWLGAFGLRGAGSLRTQGGTAQATPYVKTDSDRREEMTPMLRREDCEAFVEQSGPELWFCIARGDKRKGPLPIVERVPWESFGNFEEGSHKQWFRPRASVSDVADWGVIIAQSSVGRVLRVAESVNDHAWLVELLVRLQNTFVAPRDSIIRALRESAQKQSAPAGTTTGIGAPAMGETPVKPF